MLISQIAVDPFDNPGNTPRTFARRLRNPAFLAALTLRERLDLLSEDGSPPECSAAELHAGSQRLLLWKGQKVFADTDRFEARLRAEGISEEDLLSLLASGPAPLAPLLERSGPPSWLAQLERLRRKRQGKASRPLPVPADPSAFPSAAFHPFVAPLVTDAERQMRRRLTSLFRRSPHLGLRIEAILPRLVASLQLKLCQHASRTLVLALHLARIRDALPGATSEERFQAFLASLRTTRTRRVLYEQYPVLARHLAEQVRLWNDSVLELIQRLLADWPDLCALLLAGPDDELTELNTGEGDRHRGGKSVSILSFASGLRVVYKPRSLGVDAHFQDLLRWLNARGGHPAFRTLRILERGTHGWMELVAPQPCSSSSELERFYLRQGAFLAVLYALEATDMHAENLIAAGEHPVLVDLESLFHPRDETGMPVEWEMLSRSVLRIGLLPRRIGSRGGNDGIDLSALGAAAGQLSPQGVPAWAEPGTDRMSFVRRPRELPGYQNRPNLDGREVEPGDFAGAIEKGFEDMYRLLLAHREELLGERGPLRCFQEDEIRILLRPTWVYAQVLEDSFHPDFLRDALDRDRYFDWLWSADWGHPEQARILEAERRDLLAGDIPYFSSRPASRDLFDSQGERLVEFFPRSALAEVEETLASLSERDLSRQLATIRCSLATLPAFEDLAQRPAVHLRLPGSGSGTRSLLQQARAVGERLSSLAFERDGEVGWVTLSSKGGRYLTLEPLGVDLYSGLCGVALFLAYLSAACGEARFESLARQAIHRVRRRIESGQEEPLPIGAFTGLGGVIYTLTHLSILWGDEDLLSLAQDYAGRAGACAEADEALDLVSGAAGCIGALLPLFRLTGSPEALAVARACGDRLLARAEPLDRGVGWRTSISPVPLAGFAHGNAGFAWSLAHLASVTGDGRYAACARAALEYERSLFVPDRGNWPDLRFPGAELDRFMIAWCHGAAGIGLARLTMPSGSWDAELREEIAAALKTAYQAGFGRNHSLCHGDLGNLELFLQARRHPEFESWWGLVCENVSDKILGVLAKQGVLCGTPGSVETPGLLLGLSGAGLALLRLAFPESTPSILSLDPPKISQTFRRNRNATFFRFLPVHGGSVRPAGRDADSSGF